MHQLHRLLGWRLRRAFVVCGDGQCRLRGGVFGFTPGPNALKRFVLLRALFFDGVDLVEDEAETGGEGRGFRVRVWRGGGEGFGEKVKEWERGFRV